MNDDVKRILFYSSTNSTSITVISFFREFFLFNIGLIIIRMNDDVKRDFSELPIDVLSTIADKSLSLSDLVWFGAVCVSWRLASLANSKHIKLPSSSLPVLLLPSPPSDENEIQYLPTDDEDDYTEDNQDNQQTDGGEDTDDDDDDCEYLSIPESNKKTNTITRNLYSLYDEKVYDCQLDVGGDCRSSSHGWLVVTTEADQNYSVRLLNPFKSFNNVIELPPLTAFQLEPGTEVWDSAHLMKAVISASPSSCSHPKDIVVMAIHGCYRVSFCRPGDKAWTALPDEMQGCDDIIYYNGLFYAILQSGQLFAIEFDPIHSKLKDFKVLIDVPRGDCDTKYIVESSGELLQVKRMVVSYPTLYKYKTIYFKVFKLDQTGFNSEWVEIKSLNGRILFLGHNASISLSASDFPGCKPNSIYFTDDKEEIFKTHPTRCGPHDIGIYNLEDESFEPHYPMQKKAITPHPIWIQPTL